jgi:hypothetical protein
VRPRTGSNAVDDPYAEVVPKSIRDEAASLVDHPILTEYGCSPDTDTELTTGAVASSATVVNVALAERVTLPAASALTTR